MNKTLTITEFCNFIKEVIPNKKYLVSGEVNQLKNSHGHLYFTFKDSENSLSTTIWRNKIESLQINIKEGDKITVEGRLDFYSAMGKLNFIVDKIITNEGLGELLKKYEKIKDDFLKKGYFDVDRKKILKPIIKNILVLTSETGAAYQDFIFTLENSGSKVNYDLIDVIVQGVDCPKNICIEMEKIKNDKDINYDLVIITRGGGSFQDLFGFSQPELIETIYNFNLPVLSAIGHQVDNPLSDLVSDYSTPTPTLAAQFIIDHNKKYTKNLQKIKQNLIEHINMYSMNYLNKLNLLKTKINNKWDRVFRKNLENEIITELHGMLRKLDLFESKLEIFSSKDIMLYSNGKILENSQDLYNTKEKTLTILWNKVIVKVKIEKITKE